MDTQTKLKKSKKVKKGTDCVTKPQKTPFGENVEAKQPAIEFLKEVGSQITSTPTSTKTISGTVTNLTGANVAVSIALTTLPSLEKATTSRSSSLP